MGFICYVVLDVILEVDFQCCDLIINVLVCDDDGQIIDFYYGCWDLEVCLLCYVFFVFGEDFLCVLCVVCFVVCYVYLSFCIVDEILVLMCEMIVVGELEYLMLEWVWKEMENVFIICNLQVYFQVLCDCGVLCVLFLEIDVLFGVFVLVKWYLEIDIGVYMLMILLMVVMFSLQFDVCFVMFCYDLGKGLMLKNFWLCYYGYGLVGVKLVEQLCQCLCVFNDLCDLVKLVVEYYDLIYIFLIFQLKMIVKLFDVIDVWCKLQCVEQIVLISEVDVCGCIGFEVLDYLQGCWLCEVWQVVQVVLMKEVVEVGFKGIEICEELMK